MEGAGSSIAARTILSALEPRQRRLEQVHQLPRRRLPGFHHLAVIESLAAQTRPPIRETGKPCDLEPPRARASIASRTVDIPTASAPKLTNIRTSAGVSYCGPGKEA